MLAFRFVERNLAQQRNLAMSQRGNAVIKKSGGGIRLDASARVLSLARLTYTLWGYNLLRNERESPPERPGQDQPDRGTDLRHPTHGRKGPLLPGHPDP